jgi:hypothetical protein
MEQAPNAFVVVFADTSITVGWNIPGDTPDAIKVLRQSPNPVTFFEATPNDAQFFSSEYQDSGLQPGTLYTYQACCVYNATNQTLCGTVSQRTSGIAPPPPHPIITIAAVRASPRALAFAGGAWTVQPNGVNLAWQSSAPVEGLNVQWIPASGGPTGGINQGGAGFPAGSGSTLIELPTKGVPYNVSVRGQLGPNNWTDWSQDAQVIDPPNYHSLRDFLTASRVNGSNGIRRFFPPGATSLGYWGI